MKKTSITILLAIAMLVAIFALTACGQPAQKVKVYETYELTSEGYAFGVTKGETELLNSANELLKELKESGELDKIITSFFDGTSTYVYENPVTTVPTDKSKYLIVATNATFPPFEYYNGNKFTGIDIQIAELLAKKLGKTLYVYDMEFDAVVETVKEGSKANICMAGLTVTEDRKKDIDFTEEYYESAQVLVTTEGNELFADCKSAEDIIAVLEKQSKTFKIGTQSGTTGYIYSNGDEGFGYEGFKNLTTKGYTAGGLAMKDLSNGRIDAVIIDKQPAIMMAEQINAGIKE